MSTLGYICKCFDKFEYGSNYTLVYCRCRVIEIVDGKYYRVRVYRVYKLIKYADI